MTYFRILTVGLATISLVAGNPQLFSIQIGNPSGSNFGGSGPRGPRYESASSGPRPEYPGGSRVRGYQGLGGPPSSSIYESAPPSLSDYESSPPSSYESSSPSNSLYSSGPPSRSPYSSVPPSGSPYSGGPPSGSPYSGGPPSGSPYSGGPPSGSPYSGGPPSGSPYSGGPPSSSLYESAPESLSSDDDDAGSYESSSPSAGDYQSLGGPPSSGGLTYQSSSSRPQYHGRPGGGLDGYRSGPPPGFAFQGSPQRPEYLQGGPPGGPRGPPSESLPMRIGRGIMGLLASASGPPNFFAPPRGPTYVPASSKSATFYLEPPSKDSPSFYGVRTIAAPNKQSSSSRVKSPFSFLASETNNQLPRENTYTVSASNGGRPVQSVQQIVAQAAQAQHAKVLRKEQQAHPSGKITHSQIRLAGAGQQTPTQYQSQAYLDPYSASGIGGQQAGVYSQQLVMTTGPDGNPVLLQVQRPRGPVQFTGQLPAPAPSQPQFTSQQPTLLQYTGQQPPQQYSTIGTTQQANAAIAASPQSQQGQVIEYIQPANSQGPISLTTQQGQPQQPQFANFPSVQFLQPAPGQQAHITPYTVAPQFLAQQQQQLQQQQPQLQQLQQQQQGGGIDISQYSLTTEPQTQQAVFQQGQQFYQTLPGQSPFGVSSQDGQQILLNQIGQIQQQQQLQQQQLQQQPQLLKQSSSNNNQQGFQIQEAIQTHQQLQSENLQQQQQQQQQQSQQQLGQQSRQVQSQSASGTSNNPIQFSQQDSIGAFSSISEEQDTSAN